MKYDFSTKVNRKNTGAKKWDFMYAAKPAIDEEILPLSVADMEFKNAPEIYEGLIEFLKKEPILGYSQATDDYYQAVKDWQQNRHQWAIEKDWIIPVPGTVAAINAGIRSFSDEKDGIIIFSPVYHPFKISIEKNNRKVVDVPLIEKDLNYEIDFEQFEKTAAENKNKMLLFCSPHNPVGRVWTNEELEKIAEISLRHNLIVLSDEVWYDFVRPDVEHTVFHKVNEDLAERMIVFAGASKTFNLAGAITSNVFISNPELREQFVDEIEKSNTSAVNIFGLKTTELAYRRGEAWLEELLQVIWANQEFVHDFFAENYPKIKAPISEGTYVQWLDFRALKMNDEELEAFLLEHDFVANLGQMFGEKGSGFVRICVVLPTDALQKQLKTLLEALQELEN